MGIAEPAWLSREVSSAKGGLGRRRGGERQQIAAWLLGNCWKYQGFSQASREKERALFWSLEAPEKFITT